MPDTYCDPSLRARILNAAYKEFTEHGYDRASTNRIVEQAGVGKGLLFYYFNSKEELFHHLVEHGIEYMTEEYLARLDEGETDFIEKCRQAAKVKMRVYMDRPHLLNFLSSVFLNDGAELPGDLRTRLMETTEKSYAKLFSNIDTSLFRDDLDPDRVIKLIQWSLDGYTEEITNQLRGKNLSEVDMIPFWEEFDDYLSTLRKAFYGAEGEE